MAMKKRGLGRGLDALLGGIDSGGGDQPQVRNDELKNLPVELIQPGKYQPRTDIHAESLEDLANSIRAQGVVQPIVVRMLNDSNKYEIIAGERRWRAAQLAELHEIPAVIRNVPDEAAIAMALIENIQREDLNPMEEANAFQRLIDEFHMTHQQVAEAVGRSRVTVTNLLRLLTLNDDVKRMVERGELEMGHARALLTLEHEQQSQAAREVIEKQLSVRETEKLVRRIQSTPEEKRETRSELSPDIKKFQEDLSERLGAKVAIQHGPSGKGKLLVHYNNLDELEGILAHIK